MRQVARRAGVQRGQEQKRAGLMRGDELSRQFAREMKAGIDIDRPHLLPGLARDRERVIGLAPRRRRAVNEVRHLPHGGLRVGQQRIAGGALCEIAGPCHRQFRPRRSLDGGCDGILVYIGKHGAHALADQRLRDRTSNAVSRTGHQRRLARGIEWMVQQAHGGRHSLRSKFNTNLVGQLAGAPA